MSVMWKLKGYPPNRLLEDYDILCGPFFIAGLKSDSIGSISDELEEKYTDKFRHPEMFMRTMRNTLLCFRPGSGEPPLEIG